METVVIIIMAMVGLGFALKLSYHGWPGRAMMGLLCGVFVLMTYEAASAQSKTQISDWLSQPDLMLDTSVWLTIDVAFQICFCVLAAMGLEGSLKKRERILYLITLWVPGILIFPTLFSVLTELMFSLTGVDFATIGWSVAGAAAVGIPLLGALIKWGIPEKEIRLEILFMVNLIIAALGIVATVNGRTAAVGSSEIEWGALLAISGIILIGLIAGLVIYRYINAKKISKLQ